MPRVSVPYLATDSRYVSHILTRPTTNQLRYWNAAWEAEIDLGVVTIKV